MKFVSPQSILGASKQNSAAAFCYTTEAAGDLLRAVGAILLGFLPNKELFQI